MSKNIKITEVCLRDGLQNETREISVDKKLDWFCKIQDAGFTNIEVGSFVSYAKIPQLKGTKELMKKIVDSQRSTKELISLVPNEKGLELAVDSGFKKVAVFLGTSNSFNQKNIDCTTQEGLDRYLPLIQKALDQKVQVRGYISTVFGCPYGDRATLEQVLELSSVFLEAGCYEVSLGDTTGLGTPSRTEELIDLLRGEVDLSKIAMHFHDTRHMALANILVSYQKGIRSFDGSIAGLGGCPYSKSPSGNVATDSLIYLFNSLQQETGINFAKLLELSETLSKEFNRNPIYQDYL